jgi:hypothetical protein
MERLLKKEAAVEFILEYASIARIQAAAELIRIAEKSEDNSDHLRWTDFFERITREILDQMSDELRHKIQAYPLEELHQLIQGLEKDARLVNKELTEKNINEKILVYNHSLEQSKSLKKIPPVMLNLRNYMVVVWYAQREFNASVEGIVKLYNEKTILSNTSNAQNQYPIPHKLRWIESRTDFDGFWQDLIDDSSIVPFDTSQNKKTEMLTTLNIVFEKVQLGNKNRDERIKIFEPLPKAKLYIPSMLKWNRSPKEFVAHFKPFLNAERCIFIDKYDVTELPRIIDVLTSFIYIPKEKGEGAMNPKALGTMFKNKSL